MKLLRVDSEDLKLVVSDSDAPILRIDATGWLELEDMKNLRDFLSEAITERSPTPETSPAPHVETI